MLSGVPQNRTERVVILLLYSRKKLTLAIEINLRHGSKYIHKPVTVTIARAGVVYECKTVDAKVFNCCNCIDVIDVAIQRYSDAFISAVNNFCCVFGAKEAKNTSKC